MLKNEFEARALSSVGLVSEQLDELRRWYDATTDREEKFLEVKREVNELLIQAGKPPRYESVT
jgi:hypothetical protein